ncbi:unnamed protein product [Plutella xylostella]|uniref:(diamondback moth) hypothetical protein n=1 Tax=Plutella xylostella TaxID=51655 RepID=A0A8S4G5B4_PLUXY|nr:unnamed protein product [Plutella xylostella]
MPQGFPVITIQCDWNEALKLPNSKVWISSKYLNEKSVHDQLVTAVNQSDGKIKISLSPSYQYVSHSNLSLVLKHISGVKIAFVAATKAHKVHNKAVLSVAAAENALAVSSCEADQLLVWDSRTNDILLDLKGHGGPVYKCRFFPSGIVILSAGADGSCRIWSAETGVNPVTLKGHTMAICDVEIVEKGRNVISVSRDGCAKLWDVGESRCLDNILEGHGPMNCCTIATTTEQVDVNNPREIGTGNKLLVVGCESGLVLGAHVARRLQIFSKQLDAACNACVTLEHSALIGCENGKVYQLSLRDGSILKEWHESANLVLSLAALSADMFAVGRQDGSCTVYSLLDAHSATRVHLTGSDCDGIRDIAFNGKWILAASRDCLIRKYDFNQVIVHFK